MEGAFKAAQAREQLWIPAVWTWVTKNLSTEGQSAFSLQVNLKGGLGYKDCNS